MDRDKERDSGVESERRDKRIVSEKNRGSEREERT